MITGGCLCGTVRYEINGRVSPISLCHCSKCRRANGSAFHAGAACRQSKFRWLQGENLVRQYRSPSGYTTCFCPSCGSPLPMLIPDGEYAILPVGTLDGDPGSRAIHHIFFGSRAAWDEMLDDLPHYHERAPDEL